MLWSTFLYTMLRNCRKCSLYSHALAKAKDRLDLTACTRSWWLSSSIRSARLDPASASALLSRTLDISCSLSGSRSTVESVSMNPLMARSISAWNVSAEGTNASSSFCSTSSTSNWGSTRTLGTHTLSASSSTLWAAAAAFSASSAASLASAAAFLPAAPPPPEGRGAAVDMRAREERASALLFAFLRYGGGGVSNSASET
mmetsp:Transcript_4871/g.12372  ORF Transcript_4871/g.12372 Transcript_4871/m.12372 type:complete len:201 (-) Transcript_4871:902-1504(-)